MFRILFFGFFIINFVFDAHVYRNSSGEELTLSDNGAAIFRKTTDGEIFQVSGTYRSDGIFIIINYKYLYPDEYRDTIYKVIEKGNSTDTVNEILIKRNALIVKLNTVDSFVRVLDTNKNTKFIYNSKDTFNYIGVMHNRLYER